MSAATRGARHNACPEPDAARAQTAIARRFGARVSGAFLAVSLLGMLGCDGVRWRLDRYDRVHDDAVRDKRLTFVYFRHWAAVQCTEFEEKVLKDAAVLAETKHFYCVPLAFDWDRELADQWDVREPPGVVIVGVDDRVLGKLCGVITRDALLALMRRAVADSQPASAASP